jgi:hypothetical protein
LSFARPGKLARLKDSSSFYEVNNSVVVISYFLGWSESFAMNRRWILSLLFLVAAGFHDVGPAQAEVISQDNPYRSYNISGVNYASMQWERSHKGKSSSRNRNNGWFIRRNHDNASNQVVPTR